LLRSVLRWLRHSTAKLHYTKNAHYSGVRRHKIMRAIFIFAVLLTGCASLNTTKELHNDKWVLIATESLNQESKLECGETIYENYHALEITSTHCIDLIGADKDGLYSEIYDYEVFVFRKGNIEVSGRRYRDTPGEAALIRISISGNSRLLTPEDFQNYVVEAAIKWLRSKGITDIDYLDKENTKDGYTSAPRNDT